MRAIACKGLKLLTDPDILMTLCSGHLQTCQSESLTSYKQGDVLSNFLASYNLLQMTVTAMITSMSPSITARQNTGQDSEQVSILFCKVMDSGL